MAIQLIGGEIDLSVGYNVMFSNMVAGILIVLGVPAFWAIIITVLSACVIGFIVGLLVAYFKVNSFIATLGSGLIFYGLAQYLYNLIWGYKFDGLDIQKLPESFTAIGKTEIMGIQLPVFYALIHIVVFSLLMSKSRFFWKYYYIGENKEAANLSGISVKSMKLMMFIFSANGMMVVGWDSSLATGIDKAMAAGIPVVTIDADVPGSKRLAFVGTDWYMCGYEQGRAVGEFLKDKKGKAVCIGVPGADNNTMALNGYTKALKELAPGIEVEQKVYDSQVNAQKVTETITNLIKSDPTILAVAGFDTSTGAGIGQAIKETGNIGKIARSCVDAEAEQLQCVKEGSLLAAIGQKRHFFTYYGVRLLYDYNHNNIEFTLDDKAAGITPIPSSISTGFITVNAENVELMLKTIASKTK